MPDCQYEYYYDKYEDGHYVNDEDYLAELEDLRYEQSYE